MCSLIAQSLALISGIQLPAPGVPLEVVNAVSGGCQDCGFKLFVVSVDLFDGSFFLFFFVLFCIVFGKGALCPKRLNRAVLTANE